MTGTNITNRLDVIRHSTARRTTHLWGQPCKIKPTLVSRVFGDGLQLIALEPMDTRPDRYVLMGDSKWETGNDPLGNGKTSYFSDHLDDIYDTIEGEFGRNKDEYEGKNGRTYVKHWPFPALDCSSGCCRWWEIATFTLV